tara:strand:- start:399 stop:575 length:177 start_codon:yes stop_codon:yes gene_type:complete
MVMELEVVMAIVILVHLVKVDVFKQHWQQQQVKLSIYILVNKVVTQDKVQELVLKVNG